MEITKKKTGQNLFFSRILANIALSPQIGGKVTNVMIL